MNRKNLISLSIAFAFLSLSVTGILLYIGKKPHFVETIHVIFGLLFIAFALYHITNNWSSLVSYTKSAGGKIRKEFLIVLVFFALFLAGTAFELPPFPQLKEAGEDLFRERRERRERVVFETVGHPTGAGAVLTLIIQKKTDVHETAIVVWAEDTEHRFINNLFVPAQMESAGQRGDEKALRTPLKPDVFPHWKTIATSIAPTFQGTTPSENFILTAAVPATGKWTLWLETPDELYHADIDTTIGAVTELKSTGNVLLERAVAEVR